ncbi:MAG: TGS domain-containing protein [Candidatus Aenigmatarchaeota archaeon]|nr:TGS domain-containing protein [Candidatus Aenigmarchaeota archaeon]
MPINARPEFFKAQAKFLAAKTREEKIAALEEMLATAPNHKGAETLRAQLRAKLAKLKQEQEKKSTSKSFSIPKEGDAQICLIGITQSGKSTILTNLTNAKPKISNVEYTTQIPEVGCMDYDGVKIQIIEIPSTFKKIWLSIAKNADAIIFVLDGTKDTAKQKFELENILGNLNKPSLTIITKIKNIDYLELKRKIWEMLNLIRVYTKEPTSQKPEERPLVLKSNSTVRDAVLRVHKDLVKFFKFARIWGSSVKYPGERVGLDHVLKDKDILEIHT